MLPQSAAYQDHMQRFVALIAIIFAFASLAGTTTAHAHRYFSMPIVVLNHVDQNNVSIPVFVQVQRGEIDLGSGIVMPCGPHHAIPVRAPQLPAGPDCDHPVTVLGAAEPLWAGQIPLRPPKPA
ncbi:hypothetical protein O9Z70_01470 [Devosia sp. YIM 151766]|uniref:hypothetical protein n=1 Tax=Devosia sp. YIM 151766 TaxID=3017325 RepID=UPI00255D0E94|nr:hypothetical protein [Devosia sp. YIM 151766]WIY53241.1 hypothetical protein O9Z70_01470 [Devosia sp. YIM 151766]